MRYAYTEEQDKWLCEHWVKRGGECVQEFNEIFGESRSYHAIRTHCQKVLNLRISKELKSATARANAKRYVPIGSVVKSGDYWEIKIADEYGKRTSNWMLLHHYNYIKAYGEIPKGMVVIFLDGNQDNCEASNLKAIPQAINALLMKKDLRSIHGALTATGIEWCKLHQMLQEDGYFEREKKREQERRKAKMYANLNADQKVAVKMLDKDGNFIKAYGGVSEAARSENLSASHISACARGKRHTCGGYVWEYL